MDSGMSEFSAGGRSLAAVGGGNSMFSRTCNLLSYSKESGNFGDLSLGMCAASKEAFRQTARTTMDLLPLLKKSKDDGGSGEPETAQMTIFYGGQVLAFKDLTADKANEIMRLASNFAPSSSSVATTSSNSNLPREQPSSPIPIACDVRIARKASLQRFLAMRKNRIAARSPYRIRN